ncbi:hypothetical protein TIFTF001_013659 [Ficus carica]|uniref:Uncharacterized protein n=1 Tax=Ficus carica TaxID=3494 RepID=A0AA88AEP2_FICCA|nr:hypothetical protein TIFTF001_013659 [Ficus carica]
MQHQRLKQQDMMQHSLYHHLAVLAAPQNRAFCEGHLFFVSLPISKELIAHIKKDGTVLPRIGALIEMNLEFFAIDSQGFITNNERALEELFGDEEDTRKGVACLNVMATCIATVFASLRNRAFKTLHVSHLLEGSEWSEGRQQRRIPSELESGERKSKLRISFASLSLSLSGLCL